MVHAVLAFSSSCPSYKAMTQAQLSCFCLGCWAGELDVDEVADSIKALKSEYGLVLMDRYMEILAQPGAYRLTAPCHSRSLPNLHAKARVFARGLS